VQLESEKVGDDRGRPLLYSLYHAAKAKYSPNNILPNRRNLRRAAFSTTTNMEENDYQLCI